MPSKVLGVASRGLDDLLLADLTAVLQSSEAMYNNTDIPHASDTTLMSSLDTSRAYILQTRRDASTAAHPSFDMHSFRLEFRHTASCDCCMRFASSFFDPSESNSPQSGHWLPLRTSLFASLLRAACHAAMEQTSADHVHTYNL